MTEWLYSKRVSFELHGRWRALWEEFTTCYWGRYYPRDDGPQYSGPPNGFRYRYQSNRPCMRVYRLGPLSFTYWIGRAEAEAEFARREAVNGREP